MGRHRLGNANPASGAAGSAYLFELRLDTLRLALPLDAVLRTTRVAEITPLPGAPSIVAGAINIAGEVLAAIDLRGRLALPARPLELDDCFVLVRSGERVLAILASEVSGVAKYPASACVASARVTPGLQGLGMDVGPGGRVPGMQALQRGGAVGIGEVPGYRPP